jgi:hypothetical protein
MKDIKLALSKLRAARADLAVAIQVAGGTDTDDGRKLDAQWEAIGRVIDGLKVIAIKTAL